MPKGILVKRTFRPAQPNGSQVPGLLVEFDEVVSLWDVSLQEILNAIEPLELILRTRRVGHDLLQLLVDLHKVTTGADAEIHAMFAVRSGFQSMMHATSP